MSRTSCVVNSPRAPRLDGELEDVALGPEELGDGASVERALIAGAGLAGVHASGFTLMEARLVDVDLSGPPRWAPALTTAT